MRSVALLVAVLLSLGGDVAASTDFRFPAVFNFGDSNSDTGGRVAAGFESILPPYGSTFFGTPSGRFCDGRLIVDFLSTLASLIPLSLASVPFCVLELHHWYCYLSPSELHH
jgi:hypothetical protein